MSKIISFNIDAHDNVYIKRSEKTGLQSRKMDVKLAIPDGGTNEDSGMLVLIPGYGGNMSSNIFEKMRREFSDQYNLAVIQCDYFGNCYMNTHVPENIQSFLDDANVVKADVEYRKDTKETLEEFNDMGIMQALDVVTAVIFGLRYIMTTEEEMLNTKKVIAFGTSHGAYLAHLSNLICPQLFSCIVDVSSYLSPYYLCDSRELKMEGKNRCLKMSENFFLSKHKELQYNSKLYDLRFLYRNAENYCKIIAFQGSEDWMVNYREKKTFIRQIGENAQLMLITPDDVDGVLCKNANHGLGLDFLELFKMLMPMLNNLLHEKSNQLNLPKTLKIGDESAYFQINYQNVFPEIEHITFAQEGEKREQSTEGKIKTEEEWLEHIFNSQKKFLSNFQFYCNGYSLYALEKILPTDAVFVAVGGAVTENEIKKIDSIRDKACIMTNTVGLKSLKKAGIKPDFIFLEPASERNVSCATLEWKEVPLITCTSADTELMVWHNGPKFFYWVGNMLEQSIWYRARQASAARYQYNKLTKLDISEDTLMMMVQLGIQMGAKSVLIAGAKNMQTDILYGENVNILHIDMVDELENNNCIKIELSSILSEIIPFFDKNGQSVFCEEYIQLKEELHCYITKISEGIKLYQQLYDMTESRTVAADMLSIVTKRLNQFISELENGPYFGYIWSLAKEITQFQSEVQLNGCNNEIMQMAWDGKFMLKKLKLVCQAMEKSMNCLPDINKYKQNIYHPVQHKKNILLIYGVSAYNVLPRFARELEKGFQKIGYQTFSCDVGESVSFRDGYNFYQNTVGYDYILLINGVYINIEYEDWVIGHNRYWYDSTKTQVLAMFFDHPIYHQTRLEFARSRVKTIFCDTKYKPFIQTYMPEVKNIFITSIGGIEQKNEKNFFQKENKVVFFGSYGDLEIVEKSIHESGYEVLIWRIIELLNQRQDLTIEDAFEYIGRVYGCEHSMENILVHTGVFRLIDQYIRLYYRNKVILTIAESEIPIDIYGWRNMELSKYPNVQLKEDVSFEEMGEICKNTRFVLNVNPWTKGGVQERVFNTMLGKSVCITDMNGYLAKECIDGKNVVFYELDKIECLPKKIKYYMEHEQLSAQIAENGFAFAQKNHTWAKVAEQIADMLEIPNNI